MFEYPSLALGEADKRGAVAAALCLLGLLIKDTQGFLIFLTFFLCPRFTTHPF